ncbi:hypothetical protein EV385_3666 [Krasilnikovia cinnamomea]|uniref:Flavin reductase (DIM6/NTAB) family NADH-FMN oxidoreductase RutF n=1 Tax=Krasilnikovia cinnamomea TaxID=349313 RepID=A0A4Q7ZLJ4_9ACTN|nr:hypothetical protein EV385_3666 [Krasilnikovia cinnamomea]
MTVRTRTEASISARSSHRYTRPSWDCAACGEPWPCAPARAELIDQYAQAKLSLAIHLGSVLVEAIDDFVGRPGPVPDLYSRILGWIHAERFD